MDLTDESRVREIVREELSSFTPQKKKRAPNKWQIFLKECAKAQSGDLSYPEKVKACSVKYKESKKNGMNTTTATNNETSDNINNDTGAQNQ